MRLDDDDGLDEEIRGHLALSIKERGEDPVAARLAALKEFGNVTLTRDSMRRVWRHRWFDAAEALGRNIRLALRALLRVMGMAATVVVTLALGIGANAAIFSVVRGVLLRPLVNRDEDRLIYVRQGVPGIGSGNATFSVPLARLRVASPRFFAVLGIPLLAGRDFADDDREDGEPVSIVSQSVAQRLFPGGDALNRHMWWTDPYFGPKPMPRRIVGVVADVDVDDEHVGRGPAMTIYMPVRQVGLAGRLFVRAARDPYALVPAVTRIIREISADQPVERAATLEDVRADVLSPERLNAFVFSGFAGIALLIAVVGVAGVLAFSVSARTREFSCGWRSVPRRGVFWNACFRKASRLRRSASAPARPAVTDWRAWRRA